MIRLLHDPSFAARVHADPARALAGVDLTAVERAWLVAVPAAAWRTDPERPLRVFGALADEYPATCALAADHVAAFFASDEFHAAVQERGSLALAFGAHALRAADPRARAVASLEQAIASVRRASRDSRPATPSTDAPPAPAATDRLRLAARVRVLHVPAGALALLAAARAGHAPLPELGAADEPVLVVAASADAEVTVEPLTPALAALLERATGGASRAGLLATARTLGAGGNEDAEIVDGLVADGLLVRDDP